LGKNGIFFRRGEKERKEAFKRKRGKNFGIREKRGVPLQAEREKKKKRRETSGNQAEKKKKKKLVLNQVAFQISVPGEGKGKGGKRGRNFQKKLKKKIILQ